MCYGYAQYGCSYKDPTYRRFTCHDPLCTKDIGTKKYPHFCGQSFCPVCKEEFNHPV
ncbi:hypothetical protein BDV06DRAFT_206713 [Aspergillus oleicola]